MKQRKILALFYTICCFFIAFKSSSAQNAVEDVKIIDELLKNKSLTEAQTALSKQIAYYENNGQIDSLSYYPYYIGKITIATKSRAEAIQAAEEFVVELFRKTNNPRTRYLAKNSISELYDDLGEYQKSYDVTGEALVLIKTDTTATHEEIGKVVYNLGVTAQSLGEMGTAKTHFRSAQKMYESYPATSKSNLSKLYNGIGAMYYLSSKLDSAQYFFEKAVVSLKKAQGDSIENLLDATVIESNVMLVQYLQGKPSQAIRTLEQVVTNYNIVIKESTDENTRAKARRFNGTALSNLAVIYNEMGNVGRANEVMEYTYDRQKKILEPTDPKMISLMVQMAQSQLSLYNSDKAIGLLMKAENLWEQSPNQNKYWRAAGYYALAEAHKMKNNDVEAERYYQLAEPLFEASLKDEYDIEYLGFLRNKALFLSEHGRGEEAIATSLKSLNYVNSNNSSSSNRFLLTKEMENISKVYLNIGDFGKAMSWAQNGISILDEQLRKSKNSLDSTRIEFQKPNLLLLEAQAAYKLKDVKDVFFLKHLLRKVQQAINLVERRKRITFNTEAVDVLLTTYKQHGDFAKKLKIEIYNKTQNEAYLDSIVSLHESSIYNRIRARLSQQQDLSFFNVPETISIREKKLREQLSQTLKSQEVESATIKTYFDANRNFNAFMDSLRQAYPKYYRMRYATITQSLAKVQEQVPANTTIIRYVFVGESLYAFVIDSHEKHWVPLPISELNERLAVLQQAGLDEVQSTGILSSLYDSLWKPFEKLIHTDNVLIIPDGALYNLSFESLPTKPVKDYRSLLAHSLLKKYVFSYHFSLLLVKNNPENKKYVNNMIAFAPQFTNQMKATYRAGVVDSINLDQSYLTLLPQPFSADLAMKSSKRYRGSSFLNENATEAKFKKEAAHHKIIHIGTHAESNNINPELSKLVFAKNTIDSADDDNFLYTYEIYNTDLSSNLAILTACETGKPSYQPGEGMISLAHAFNYSGSESMLTSLWKIDEKSSAEIIGYFYEELSKGLTKDEALRNSKVRYLENAEGRTLAPQYWAGLVVFGDTAPISLAENPSWWLWALFAVCITFVVYLLVRRKVIKL